MPEARVVAQQLAAKFLANGNYTFANPMNAAALGHVMPAASSGQSFADFFDESGFEGLEVQSIGYEKGAEEPKVHIYVTKGSLKGIKSLPDEEHGVKRTTKGTRTVSLTPFGAQPPNLRPRGRKYVRVPFFFPV
jgi:hypothetical protein